MAGASAGVVSLRNAHPGRFELDLARRHISLSEGLTATFGLDPERFDGSAAAFLERMFPADRKQLQRQVRTAQRQLLHHDVRAMGTDGQLHWFSVEADIERDAQGEPVVVRGILQEIDPELALERRMHDQQAALFQLLAAERLDTLPLDEALARVTRQISLTLAVERVSVWRYARDDGALICQCLYRASSDGLETGMKLSAEDYPRYFAALAESRAVAAADACEDPRTSEFADGYLRPLGISSMLDATVRRGGRMVGVICHEHVGPARNWTLDEEQFAASAADLLAMLYESHERRELLKRLRYESSHDRLTGLPNRSYLRELIEAQDEAGQGALMLVDLDQFSEINDTLGHDVGDELLIALAGRLMQAFGHQGVLARLGGDEFAFWQGVMADPSRVMAQAQTLRSHIRLPIEAAGGRFSISASVGVSLYPMHGRGAQALMRCADVALSRAKKALSGCRLYSEEDDRHSPRRLTLLHDLREAAARGNIAAVFQPKYRLADGRIAGVEALARWHHPELGPVNPSEFIPLAEMGDMIVHLTHAVLQQAGRAWRQWQQAGVDVPVAVNLSASMLGDPDLPALLAGQVDAAGIPWQRLNLEITESAYLDDPQQALVSMRQLRDRGASFHLDDFGVGYSSFSHLSQMPIDALKIDRVFVQGMLDEPRCGAIVQSVIQLARNLGLRVIAEGVETDAVQRKLTALGCDEAQGFVLGRPMSAQALAEVLAGSGG